MQLNLEMEPEVSNINAQNSKRWLQSFCNLWRQIKIFFPPLDCNVSSPLKCARVEFKGETPTRLILYNDIFSTETTRTLSVELVKVASPAVFPLRLGLKMKRSERRLQIKLNYPNS